MTLHTHRGLQLQIPTAQGLNHEDFLRSLSLTIRLKLQEITGDIAVNSLYTIAEFAELLSNKDFSVWTDDDPDNWSVVEVGDSSSNITQAPDGSLNIISDGTAAHVLQTVLTVGTEYTAIIKVSEVQSGTITHGLSGISPKQQIISTPGTFSVTFVAENTNYVISRASACDVKITEASVRRSGNLLENSDFSAWTADDPDDYTVFNESGGVAELSEVAAGEFQADAPTLGGNHANFWTADPGANLWIEENGILTIGDTYRAEVDVNGINTGGMIRIHNSNANLGPNLLIAEVTAHDFIAVATNYGLKRLAAPNDATVASTSIEKVGELDAQISSSGVTLGQIGQQGDNEAFDFTGSGGFLDIVDPADQISEKQTFEYIIPISPDTAGEGPDLGHLFEWGSGGGFWLRFDSGLTAFRGEVPDSIAGGSVTITDEGVTAGIWAVIFASFQADKNLHLYRGDPDGTVTELNTTTQTPLSNLVASQSGNTLRFMNNGAANRAVDGTVDEVIVGDLLTDGERERFTRGFFTSIDGGYPGYEEGF